jgi:hypothetical protein
MAMVAAVVRVEVIGRSIAEGSSAQGETTARARAKANAEFLRFAQNDKR